MDKIKDLLDKISDSVTNFIGSWYFILSFFGCLFGWILLQFVINVDPFPYILLNLVLSTLAAVQGSIIMMAQRRQDVKDRTNMEEMHRLITNCEKYVQKMIDKQDDT